MASNGFLTEAVPREPRLQVPKRPGEDPRPKAYIIILVSLGRRMVVADRSPFVMIQNSVPSFAR